MAYEKAFLPLPALSNWRLVWRTRDTGPFGTTLGLINVIRCLTAGVWDHPRRCPVIPRRAAFPPQDEATSAKTLGGQSVVAEHWSGSKGPRSLANGTTAEVTTVAWYRAPKKSDDSKAARGVAACASQDQGQPDAGRLRLQ